MKKEITEIEAKQIDLTLELLLTYTDKNFIVSSMTFFAFDKNGITNEKRVEFICEKLNILGVFELKHENKRADIHFFKDRINMFLTKGGMTDIWLDRENKRANIKLINKTLSEFKKTRTLAIIASIISGGVLVLELVKACLL
jgi:hypothetical protein